MGITMATKSTKLDCTWIPQPAKILTAQGQGLRSMVLRPDCGSNMLMTQD